MSRPKACDFTHRNTCCSGRSPASTPSTAIRCPTLAPWRGEVILVVAEAVVLVDALVTDGDVVVAGAGRVTRGLELAGGGVVAEGVVAGRGTVTRGLGVGGGKGATRGVGMTRG